MEKPDIAHLEETLRIAMINSDINALDNLLSSDLVFTNHLGQVMSKDDDLNAHRSGLFIINDIISSEQNIHMHKNIVVVSVKVELTGSYNSAPSKETLRFTRIWSDAGDGNWQIIAGHSSRVN